MSQGEFYKDTDNLRENEFWFFAFVYLIKYVIAIYAKVR